MTGMQNLLQDDLGILDKCVISEMGKSTGKTAQKYFVSVQEIRNSLYFILPLLVR
jgi:hypothetical protein